MAIYRSIQMSFWTDSKVTEDFTPEDKYFYLYLFTNPHTNLAGCYELSTKLMAYEMGYSKDTVDRLIDRFVNIHKVIDYCPETKEVLLINWHKYNWTKSEKFRKPLEYEISQVRCSKFKEFLGALFSADDTVSIRYLYRTDTSVTVSVYNTDTDIYNNSLNNINNINNIYTDRPKKKVVKFVPPTVDEISEYCRERKNNVNPEKFFDFYESKGWMIGKNKMKDWKAAVRTWERGDNKSASSKSTPVSNIMEYEIDNGDTHPQIPPYYGFPKEWFDGDDPVRDRFVKVKQVRNFSIGVTDDTIYSPDELWDKFILRKRGYEYEQQFGFNDCP